jgi:hypothetical protein
MSEHKTIAVDFLPGRSLGACSAKATMKTEAGADDGIRTRDLRFTKPLLYQLSYVGAKRAKHCIRWRLRQALSCSRFAVRSA